MNNDLLLVDFIGDDDFDDNIYDYTDNHKYQKCNVCNLKYKNKYQHCCQCGYKWKDNTQIYCDKCYKTGIISFNIRGVNITQILQKFNGYGKLYDIKGKPIFMGNLKNGKYKEGILYSENGKLQYKGDFNNGLYNGFGVLVQNNTFINAVFRDSQIIVKFKEFPKVEKEQNKDTCHLCADDIDEAERFPICGSKKCMECCIKCIKSYFDNINSKRGSMLTPNMLLCPFCRNDIADDIIKIYNPELGKYISDIKKLDKEKKEIVGLCSECDNYEIRELNVECGEQANKEKFICQKCLETKSFENVKSCPNCNIKVYKLDGCHWMKCKCNKAWCWHCLTIFEIADGHNWNCKVCGK